MSYGKGLGTLVIEYHIFTSEDGQERGLLEAGWRGHSRYIQTTALVTSLNWSDMNESDQPLRQSEC